MDKHVFDGVVRELYAAFGKPEPRPAVLDAAFKAVAGLPDEFAEWASERLQDADRLPSNLGRELKRMYPAWKAEAFSAPQHDPWANECSGDPHCPDCGGSGWHYVWRRPARSGTAPTAIPCLCNTVVDAWEDPPRRASLEDLRRAGIWTLREPPMVRTRPPVPMRRPLAEAMAGLRAGRGVPEDAPDPRRQMQESVQ